MHNHASGFIQRLFDWRLGGEAGGGDSDEDGDQKIDRAVFRKAKCAVYVYMW